MPPTARSCVGASWCSAYLVRWCSQPDQSADCGADFQGNACPFFCANLCSHDTRADDVTHCPIRLANASADYSPAKFLAQLGSHAATDHCQTKRESIGTSHSKSHYDSRSAYASSNNSSDSAVFGAQSRAHDVPHIGIVVSALYCKPNQHGHL